MDGNERNDLTLETLLRVYVFNNHEKTFEHPLRVYYFRGRDRNEIKYLFDRSSNSKRIDTLEEELRIL